MDPIPIPRTVKERVLLVEQCKHDLDLRRRVLRQCRFSPRAPLEERVAAITFFANTFAWHIDPRNPGEGPQPMILADFQIEKIIVPLESAIERGDDHWWEKSRGTRFTWTFLVWAFHGWLFRPYWQGLLGSYEEKLVDDGTLFSHFGKLDFLIDLLPEWFMPEVVPGFRRDKHRLKLVLKNPNKFDASVRGNILQGDSASHNFGRGGRFLWAWLDEAASWPFLSESMASCSLTVRCRLGGSTPRGMNYWGHWVHNPAVKPKVTRIRWDTEAGFSQAWYEEQCRRLVDPVLIAQELDLDYTGSVEGRVYPQWDLCEFGHFPYEPDWPLYVSWDFGLDTTAIIWWQRDPATGQVRMIDCYQNSQLPIDFYVPFVTGQYPADYGWYKKLTEVDRAKIAVHSTWHQVPVHYGDPSVKQRDVSNGQSPWDVLASYGIYVVVNDQARDFKTRKQMTARGLKGLQVNLPADPTDPINCHAVNEAMQQARYPRRNPDGQYTAEVSKPVHDRTSHLRTAVEYFFVNLPPRPAKPQGGRQKTKMIYDDLI